MCFNEEVLHQLWSTELEIMDVFHSICAEHDLKYSLAFGSLIGAVRHKGFIPWDDDIDIIMPREDYETFIDLWNKLSPTGYVLQNKDTDTDFEQNFTKIRKLGTAFIQNESECSKKYHKGIFIDIAPCDRVPMGKIKRTVHYIACAVELLYSKEHTSGNGGWIGAIEKILLKCPNKYHAKIRRYATNIIKHWNYDHSLEYICSDTIRNCKRYFPSDLFENVTCVQFQGKIYCSICKPDDFLKVRYGDYMKLPPESERVWKHHPIIIDFEHNYEELDINK